MESVLLRIGITLSQICADDEPTLKYKVADQIRGIMGDRIVPDVLGCTYITTLEEEPVDLQFVYEVIKIINAM